MLPLGLDFRAGTQASRWLGRSVLTIALAFGAHVVISYVQTRDRVDENEARLEHLDRSAGSARLAGGPASVEEMDAARETVQRLSLEWGNLFNALEASVDVKGAGVGDNAAIEVSLLGIDPDARTGTAVIGAEAKDYETALRYVAKLTAAPKLRNVHLVKHESHEGARRPLAFTVSVAWKDSR